MGDLTVSAPACAVVSPGRVRAGRHGADGVVRGAAVATVLIPDRRRRDVPRDARVFGEHKTLRGFVVMVPAAAVSFAALAAAIGDPAQAGLWPLTIAGYAGLGACAGFGFMAGELPNSFVKRQLGIRPGECPRGRAGAVQFVADRIDSGVGMLLAVSAIVTDAGHDLAAGPAGRPVHPLGLQRPDVSSRAEGPSRLGRDDARHRGRARRAFAGRDARRAGASAARPRGFPGCCGSVCRFPAGWSFRHPRRPPLMET